MQFTVCARPARGRRAGQSNQTTLSFSRRPLFCDPRTVLASRKHDTTLDLSRRAAVGGGRSRAGARRGAGAGRGDTSRHMTPYRHADSYGARGNSALDDSTHLAPRGCGPGGGARVARGRLRVAERGRSAHCGRSLVAHRGQKHDPTYTLATSCSPSAPSMCDVCPVTHA